jgi:membrane protease YdiL (CAAX protease family)
MAALYLAEQSVARALAQTGYERSTGTPFDLDVARIDPQFMGYLLPAHVVLSALLVLVALGIVMAWSRADWTDVGLTLRRFFADVRLGATAFVLVVPPILLLQAALAQIWPSNHPLMKGLTGGSPGLLLWSILAAVVTAPVVEELFFRGLLQGWLERLATLQERLKSAAMTDVSESVAAGTSDAVESPPPRPSWNPVVTTSLLFAVAHIGYGPDPIPIFFLGMTLGYLYRQTHRLWPGIVLHFLLNAFSTIMAVLAVKDA